MITNLLASARELRFPLTVGYGALFTIWLLFGEPLSAAAWADPLGRRLLTAVDDLGSPAEIGLITFFAAMLGSLLWHGGVARLTRYISAANEHPNWPDLIDQSRKAAREYGEYQVITNKGQSGGRPSVFDSSHIVPSPEWGSYLLERVQERERKAAEMSFRVTLAVVLVPVAISLGIRGGGYWWLSLILVLMVWADVLLLKHTTLRVVNRYKLEDLTEQLRVVEAYLSEFAEESLEGDDERSEWRRSRHAELVIEQESIRRDISALELRMGKRSSRFFARIEGMPAE